MYFIPGFLSWFLSELLLGQSEGLAEALISAAAVCLLKGVMVMKRSLFIKPL